MAITSILKGGLTGTKAKDLHTFATPQVIEYLVIAGGGSGDGVYVRGGGGGGAGGYRCSVIGESSAGAKTVTSAESLFEFELGTNYTVTVGAGGATTNADYSGASGSNSVFATITSAGGGQGGAANSYGGASGGSSGGGGHSSGSSSSASNGHRGGSGLDQNPFFAGGGAGGAGGSGSSASNGGTAATRYAGSGGVGLTSSINGTATGRAGGGPGAGANTSMNSQTFSDGANSSAGNPTVNSGAGGGGRGNQHGIQRAGASGIVIIRYPNIYSITIGAGLTNSGETVLDGAYKYVEFTAGTGTVSFSG